MIVAACYGSSESELRSVFDSADRQKLISSTVPFLLATVPTVAEPIAKNMRLLVSWLEQGCSKWTHNVCGNHCAGVLQQLPESPFYRCQTKEYVRVITDADYQPFVQVSEPPLVPMEMIPEVEVVEPSSKVSQATSTKSCVKTTRR